MALRLVSPGGGRAAVLWLRRSLPQLSGGARGLTGSAGDELRGGPAGWVSPAANLLGDADRRLPLPGHVGVAEALAPPARQGDNTAQLYDDRYMAAVFSWLAPSAGESEGLPGPAAGVVLEIQAHECPQLLREEFQPLFSERDICRGRLTVLVVSQRTEGDMATWSPQIQAERAELATHFVSVGRDVARGLRRLGFWVDLVDPRSGRPHLAQPGAGAGAGADGSDEDNSRLSETDDRLARLGFTIEDLGCCRVIRHAVWGSHVFVGCLFTDAAVDDPRLAGVLAQYRELAAPPPP